MPPRQSFARSRNGCLQCRERHEKCDENRPVCSYCARRGIQCQYVSRMKWIQQTEPVVSRHRPRGRTTAPSSEAGMLTMSPTTFVDTAFKTPEEKRAWEYYVRLVSSNIPALDGPSNPYRQLSFIALSSPVLLETVLCISMEHMLNFGLGSVTMAAIHEQRMLGFLQQNVVEPTTSDLCDPQSPESINFRDHEALLAAVVLQGVVVAQTSTGFLEPHIKYASFLIKTLGLFRQPPRTPLTRTIIQRFAMNDLMLAISRQRRPYSPREFFLFRPDEDWDQTEPSFLDMTGCPQPLMCLLVRISHLACEVDEQLDEQQPSTELLGKAFSLDCELRSWASQRPRNDTGSSTRQPLDLLTECFYWTAHLLLARRVFRHPTDSPWVQHLMQTSFRLMDCLSTGCGPDSSLPQPFYLAAREALSPEDRNWARRKHEAMIGYYGERQRNAAMEHTERIWNMTDELRNLGKETPGEEEAMIALSESLVKALDRDSRLFIF